MIRLIIYGFLIYVGYRILKPWVNSLLRPDREDSHGGPSSRETEMIRDPQCGTYFMPERGIEARIGGRSITFCSKECRDKYLVNHKDS